MVTMISDEEATGKTKAVYDDIRNNFGMVPNLFKAMAAVDPDWLEITQGEY
jgi:hypothetical protein